MAGRVLSERALNRALLARQMLLERRRMRPVQAVERLGGLQTQYAPSGYIGLWSRLEGFVRADLTRALERRAIVQGTIMRVTIHMVSAADYPLLVAGVRAARREWWLRATRRRIEPETMAGAAARARALLADGPLRRSELVRRLELTSDLWNGGRPLGRPAAGAALGDMGAALGRPLRRRRRLARPRRGRPGGGHRASGPPLPGRVRAGVRPRYRELGRPAARRRRAGRRAGRAGALSGHLGRAAARPRPPHRCPLPERFRPILFNTKTPQSLPTFLVDGRVAGSWGHEDGRVVTAAFEPLSAGAAREVAAEAERLAAFMA